MKITVLEESADFATLDTEKLFSKLKSHESSRKGHPNHDASLSSKALITSARVGDHVANPTNTTVSSVLKFVSSSLVAASNEQYESIPGDEIVLLVRKFRALHKFHKERRSPRATSSKLFHATKENTELQQEVAYLTARLKKAILNKKMIEEDLSRVEESATKSTYRLSVGFERCEKKGEKSDSKFVPSSTYHKEEEVLKPTKVHYPSNLKPSFNSKRGVKRESLKPREEAFICMFYGRAGHMEEFCFRRKRIEGRRFEYARNSYQDELFDLPPRSYSCVPPRSYSRASPRIFHMLCLVSPMDLTIAHIILVHRRTALSVDILVMAHILVVVIVSRVGMIFLLEGPTPTLSRDTWMIHIFPVVVHVPLSQEVRCKVL
jgi:hypothetical protein